jgi:predicted nucleotidyltransferase
MDFSRPNKPQTFFHFEKTLKTYFEARIDIHFAMVFGSFAKDKNHPFSDLDIGIHLKEDLSLLELGSMIEDLERFTNSKVDFALF